MLLFVAGQQLLLGQALVKHFSGRVHFFSQKTAFVWETRIFSRARSLKKSRRRVIRTLGVQQNFRSSDNALTQKTASETIVSHNPTVVCFVGPLAFQKKTYS